MQSKKIVGAAAKCFAAAAGFAVGSYGTYVGVTWLRYGKPKRAHGKSTDELLDAFMLDYASWAP